MVKTVRDLSTTVRLASNETLTKYSGVKNPAALALLRRAMLLFVIDSREYQTKEEEQFFCDFMASIDLDQIGKRILLGTADERHYTEFIDDLVANGTMSDNMAVLHITQYFDMQEKYIGSWFTCYDAQRDEYCWVHVTDDWYAKVFSSVVSMLIVIFGHVGGEFLFSTYSNATGSWTQMSAGKRTQNRVLRI